MLASLSPVVGGRYCLGGTRNGWWQVPHAWRPKSFTTACVASASPVWAVSRSFTDHVSRFLAALSNSGHFCQISGFAADFSGFSEPSGNSGTICLAVPASLSASAAASLIWPAFVLSSLTPPEYAGRGARRGVRYFPILLRTGGIVFKYCAIASRSALLRSL